MNIPQIDLPRVVIIGSGFAGLKLAKKINSKYYQTVLLDKNNYHSFQPLLYQVASSGLNPDSISYPIRKIFKGKKKFHFRMANVLKIAPDQKVISTNIGKINYDILVLATGAKTNFFGLTNLEKNSFPMKTVNQALDLRSIILQNFEEALNTKDLAARNKLMNFVIVGGGATGVELAGALAELKQHILPKDYPDLDIRNMQVHIVEAADRLLAAMSAKSSRNAEKFLRKLGVNIWLNTIVKDSVNDVIQTSNGSFESKTMIWTAGVKAAGIPGLQHEIDQRIPVDKMNKLNAVEDIYAIGDLAAIIEEDLPKGHPMLASVAGQQGAHLAKNLNRKARGKKQTPFKYIDKGTMATIGRNLAVVDLKFWKFGGFFAWLTWMFVHLMLLVDYRSRVIVFINWIWNYFNYDKGTRLIIRKIGPNKKRQASS